MSNAIVYRAGIDSANAVIHLACQEGWEIYSPNTRERYKLSSDTSREKRLELYAELGGEKMLKVKNTWVNFETGAVSYDQDFGTGDVSKKLVESRTDGSGTCPSKLYNRSRVAASLDLMGREYTILEDTEHGIGAIRAAAPATEQRQEQSVGL